MQDRTKEWISFPEAIYCVHYAYEGNTEHPYTDSELDTTIESICVDAHTFIAVEDFAKANCPENWEVISIEKTYAYAKMYCGQTGDAIDVTLPSEKDAIFNYRTISEVDGSYMQDVVRKKQTFLKRIEEVSATTRR